MVKTTLLFATHIFFSYGLVLAAEAPKPLPVPKEIRVEASGPRAQVWQRLTPRQKQLAFHLIEAGRAGRLLLFHQGHRHGLALREVFQKAFDSAHVDKTKKDLGDPAFGELLRYAARFLDQSGPYAGSNRKMVLSQVSAPSVDGLIKKHSKATTNDRAEMVRLLTDPNYEVLQYPESPQGEGLELTGGNLYEKGLHGNEIAAVLDKSLSPTLNCLVRRNAKGAPTCQIQTTSTPGIIGKTLKTVSGHLTKAIAFAETPLQKEQLTLTVKYLQSGNIEEFRQANIAWVKDRSSSTVDVMIGWVEVYEDWLARIASWESYIQVVDPEISKISQRLAQKAQQFENKMPYDKYKKTFPADYSPPALMVLYLQEISSYRTAGYNLPNFDDIRKNVGAKNVIRLPLPGETEDPSFQAMWREVIAEYTVTSQIESLLAAREKVWNVLVLLHEIIGHGSGTYDESKFKPGEDPVSALGSLGSAAEEQRADLAALVFANDPLLVEVGIYTNQEEANRFRNLMYDFYVVDFLKRLSKLRTFTEAHQRGHWLFIKQLLEKKAIEWVSKEGKKQFTPQNGVLIVKNHDKFFEVARDLLARIQNIKAERKSKELVELFEKDAPLAAVDEAWAKGIIARGENLKINAGYVEQPWRITKKLNLTVWGGMTLESNAGFWKDQY